jgi:hypothetical protein
MGYIQMLGVILNNCAVSTLFSQVQGNAGQVGYTNVTISHPIESVPVLPSPGDSDQAATHIARR